MSTPWNWLATVIYPALFTLLGIYAVLAGVGRCIVLSRLQCVVVFTLASLVCAALALTTGVYALDIGQWAKPLARVASLGIVVVLAVELVHQVRKMKP